MYKKPYCFMPFFSYWSNPGKVDSIERLSQMEDSLKESINQIRLQKVCLLSPVHGVMTRCQSFKLADFQDWVHISISHILVGYFSHCFASHNNLSILPSARNKSFTLSHTFNLPPHVYSYKYCQSKIIKHIVIKISCIPCKLFWQHSLFHLIIKTEW